jgi:hypothetical protein
MDFIAGAERPRAVSEITRCGSRGRASLARTIIGTGNREVLIPSELVLQLGLRALQPLALRLRQVLAGAIDIDVSIDRAEWWGPVLRRELCSADCFNDAAIFLALVSLNTPPFRSSASLCPVTSCGQRFDDDVAERPSAAVLAGRLRAVLLVGLRVAVLRAAAMLAVQLTGLSGQNNYSVYPFLPHCGGTRAASCALVPRGKSPPHYCFWSLRLLAA